MGIESARIQRYADYNAYKKARLVDVAKDIFTKMKTNEILEWVRGDASGEDIIKAAERVKYGFDWKLNKIDEKIIYVKGDYDNGALELIDRLEMGGWKYRTNSDPEVITYISPDGRWGVNLRKKSSSWPKIEEAGYKVDATIDVMRNYGVPYIADDFEVINEIKFIYLK